MAWLELDCQPEQSVVKLGHRSQCRESAISSISRGILQTGKGFILCDTSIPTLELSHSYMCSLASTWAIAFLAEAKKR